MGLNGLTAKGVPANQPAYFLYLRIVIIVLSVVILALAAYAISIFGSYSGYVGGYTGVSGLLIFVVVKTWIIFGVLWFLEYRMPHLYYRIVAIVAYALSLVFWLSAWAWSASIASIWLSVVCYDGFCSGDDGAAKSEGASLAACAGLGALTWVLLIVHLVLFIRLCMSDAPAYGNQAELGQVSANPGYAQAKEATATAQPVYQQQPTAQPQQEPVYQQQPVQGYPQQATY